VWNNRRMTRLIARVVLVAFVGMIPIVLDAPAAMASVRLTAQLSANKPHEPVPCTPLGVTKKPDGSVWAVEECDGEKIHYRLPDK
jgi:hypothetical protein